MLHTKAQGHWPFGSGEEDFWKVFTIYGRGGHLGHVTQMPRTNFRSPDPWRLHMKWAISWQNQQSGMCTPSEDSDQPRHPRVLKDPNFLHADSEDSDQTGRMPRLIWVFAGRTCHLVGFVMRQLKFGFDWPSGFGKIFENGWRMDGQACLYYNLTNKPKGSGELKTLLNYLWFISVNTL